MRRFAMYLIPILLAAATLTPTGIRAQAEPIELHYTPYDQGLAFEAIQETTFLAQRIEKMLKIQFVENPKAYAAALIACKRLNADLETLSFAFNQGQSHTLHYFLRELLDPYRSFVIALRKNGQPDHLKGMPAKLRASLLGLFQVFGQGIPKKYEEIFGLGSKEQPIEKPMKRCTEETRIRAIKQFANDSWNGLGMSGNDSTRFALELADRMSCEELVILPKVIGPLVQFAYDSWNGMGLNLEKARKTALDFALPFCVTPQQAKELTAVWQKNYTFAYDSWNGLGMNRGDAFDYACKRTSEWYAEAVPLADPKQKALCIQILQSWSGNK